MLTGREEDRKTNCIMEFRQLRHFVAVVDASNFSRAAREVNLSQPALTRSIQNLEHRVGMQLLERNIGGVTPTEAGREFLVRARAMLNDWSRMTTDLEAIQARSEGHLRVGAAPIFSRSLLGIVVKTFLDKYPGMTATIIQDGFSGLKRAVSEREIDFALTVLPAEGHTFDETFEFTPLQDVSVNILASSSHPFAGRTNIELEEYSQTKWVFLNRTDDQTSDYLYKNGIDTPRPVVRTNSVNLLLTLLETGEYLTVLAPLVCFEAIRDGDIAILQNLRQPVVRSAGVLHLEGNDLRAANREFIKLTTDEIAHLRL